MSTQFVLQDCDVCGQKFKFGPHLYEGHRLVLYGGAFACNACWVGNHDGWAPHLEPAILVLLKERGLEPPPRNANNLLPRN
jgi:hypothetical protein